MPGRLSACGRRDRAEVRDYADSIKAIYIMFGNRKWWLATWAVLSLSSLVVGRYVRYSGSELAHSRGMAMVDTCLSAVVLPSTLALFVYGNVVAWRTSPRMWWRRCRRTCWQFGICMAVIPTAVLGCKGRWDDAVVCLTLAGALLAVALAAHVRLRYWTRG